MKLLQINIYGGRYLEELTDYINSQDYGIICLQEITGGDRFQLHSKFGDQVDLDKFPTKDCRQELEKRLPGYKSIVSKVFEDETGEHYLANGVFFKNHFEVVSKDEIHMGGKERNIEKDDLKHQDYIYKAISAQLLNTQTDERLHVISGHFECHNTAYDTDRSIQYARNLYNYIKDLKIPFVLTGDFNVDWRSVTVGQFNDLGRNPVSMFDIQNTLNPNIHRVKHLFPEGIAADNIFVSDQIQLEGFNLIKKDLSDHYGLEISFEIAKPSDRPVAMDT